MTRLEFDGYLLSPPTCPFPLLIQQQVNYNCRLQTIVLCSLYSDGSWRVNEVLTHLWHRVGDRTKSCFSSRYKKCYTNHKFWLTHSLGLGCLEVLLEPCNCTIKGFCDRRAHFGVFGIASQCPTMLHALKQLHAISLVDVAWLLQSFNFLPACVAAVIHDNCFDLCRQHSQ